VSGDHGNQPSHDEASVVGDGRLVTRVVIQGRLNPQGLELLRLEIRRLAKSYGAELTNFQVDRDEEIDLLT
jgi:hypothetical protein